MASTTSRTSSRGRNTTSPSHPKPTTSADPSTTRLAAGTGSNTPAVRGNTISSTKSSPGPTRRVSRQDRLDEIFETARKRKLMLEQEYPSLAKSEDEEEELEEEGNNSLSRGRSPKSIGGGGKKTGEMAAERRTEGEGIESSADEETYVFRRRQEEMNYQSTVVQQAQRPKGQGLRSRPSTTSIRKRGRTHDPNQPLGDEEEDEHEGWWARLLSNYGSLELENKGSVARDHLALERTFLAWLRTSLAFASIGIAITQLFRLNTTSASTGGADPYQPLRQMGKPLGATFLGISIVMLGVGFHRYFESQHWIIRGKFPASRGSIALVALITFALSIASLIIIIVVEPGHVKRK